MYEQTVSLPDTILKDAAVAESKRFAVWYDRVWRWCKKQNIVRRKVNRTAFKDPIKVASEIETMYEEVAAAVKPDFNVSEAANDSHM